MKYIASFAVVFCWIFFVLLVYHVNYHPRVYFHKTLVVSQTGEDANLSLDDFESLNGNWSGWTFALVGDFNGMLNINVSGDENSQVTIDGNFFNQDKQVTIDGNFFNQDKEDYSGYATITHFYFKGEDCENGCKD